MAIKQIHTKKNIYFMYVPDPNETHNAKLAIFSGVGLVYFDRPP